MLIEQYIATEIRKRVDADFKEVRARPNPSDTKSMVEYHTNEMAKWLVEQYWGQKDK